MPSPFGPQPINFDPDPTNFYAEVTAGDIGGFASLSNLNAGSYVDNNSDFFIIYCRRKISDRSGTFQFAKSTDGINFVLQDSANALQNLPGPVFGFVGSDRFICADIVWCAFYRFATGKIVLKPFNLVTGLWGANSPDGPTVYSFNVIGWPRVLSNGNVVISYIDDSGNNNILAIEYNGTSWGASTTLDNTLETRLFAAINSVGLDKSDTIWVLYSKNDAMNLVSYKGGVAGTINNIIPSLSFQQTEVYSGPSKYDSIKDTVLFPIGFSAANASPPLLSPKDLNLLTITTASTSPVINALEGVADRPGAGVILGNPWFAPGAFFKDTTNSTYYVSILETQQPGFGYSPPLMIVHTWSRPAAGGAWTGPVDITGVDFTGFQGGEPPGDNPVVSKLGLGTLIPATPHPNGDYTMWWLLDTSFKGSTPCEVPIVTPQAIMLSMGESMTDVSFPHMS